MTDDASVGNEVHEVGQAEARIAELEAAVRRLQAEMAEMRAAGVVSPSGHGELVSAASVAEGDDGASAPGAAHEPDKVSRRAMFRKAGVAAAGTVVAGTALSTLAASPAAAATVSGSGNPGVSATGVNGDGLVATTSTSQKSGVYAYSSTSLAYGVYAAHYNAGIAIAAANDGAVTTVRAINETGPGVYGISHGTDSYGIMAQGNTGAYLAGVQYGATLTGDLSNLYLKPMSGSSPYVYSGPRYMKGGELFQGSGGDLWHCVVGGNIGTWRKLSGPTTAGAFHLLPVPKRVYDSRPGTTPNIGSKTPLNPNEARTLDMSANSSGVASRATGVMLTILLVDAAAGNGHFTVWANGLPQPAANTMVWGGSDGRFTATAVTAIDGLGKVQVTSNLKTNLVVDVLGYYL